MKNEYDNLRVLGVVGVSMVLLTLIVSPAAASLVLYDSFDYPVGNLGGNSGGVGFGGAWVTEKDGGDNFRSESPGLTFSTLPVAGNKAMRVNTGNRAIANRPISGAEQTTLTADNSTIWFSFLFREQGNDDDFAFIFGNQTHGFPASGGNDPKFNTAGDAFGFAVLSGTGLAATKHVNSTTQTLGAGKALSGGGTIHLIAGKINWKPNGTADELYLFDIPAGALDTEPTEGTAFSSHTADFDQATFSSISMWDRPANAAVIDEIRFGTSFDAVMGVPEPSTFALSALGLLGLIGVRRRRKR
jgi:hypothetical protein